MAIDTTALDALVPRWAGVVALATAQRDTVQVLATRARTTDEANASLFSGPALDALSAQLQQLIDAAAAQSALAVTSAERVLGIQRVPGAKVLAS